MSKGRSVKNLVIVADAIIAAICVVGVYHVSQKAGIPVLLDQVDGQVRCLQVTSPAHEAFIRPGDHIRSLDGVQIRLMEEIEFLLDARQKGDNVRLELTSDNETRFVVVPLVGFYEPVYILAAAVVGALFFFVGFFVYFRRPDERATILFHWGTVAAALMILSTWGRYTIEPIVVGLGLRAAFFFAHSLLPVLFFHFTLVFPRPKWPGLRPYLIVLYVLTIVAAVVTSLTFFGATRDSSLEGFGRFLPWFLGSRWMLVALAALSLVSMVHSYRVAAEESERKRLRWVLWGLLIGFPPYVLLWVIPQIVLKRGLIPEEVVLFFSALIPITWAISIVKYRVLDIDLIINRSVVYTLVMILLLSVYAGLVGGAAVIVTTFTPVSSFAISGVSAIVVALLFEPVRLRVQRLVDRSFFRVRYDFREAQRRLSAEIAHSLNLKHLGELVVRRIEELLQPDRIGFFTLEKPGDRLHLVAHRNYDVLEKHGLRFETGMLRTPLHVPVALEEKIEPGTGFVTGGEAMFRRWGIAVACTMLSEDGEILGFLVLGGKRSGSRFTAEDLDLLTSVTAQAGLAVARIALQRKLLFEHAEAQRLEELNRLKSYFVSSVSHELKTPLTSIKMFAELLQTGKTSVRRSREYLGIIAGESERLARLINNVLDFAKVERGVMEYHFGDVRLNALVRDVMASMRYQMKMEKFRVRARFSKKEQVIRADSDAVAEALINILSNAVKYSSEKKEIDVTTFQRDGFAAVKIDDRGIGIDRKDMRNIFEPFFRARGEGVQQVGGAGLGLALVKHIVDAHGGRVEVQSARGKGSSFTLFFPTAVRSQRFATVSKEEA